MPDQVSPSPTRAAWDHLQAYVEEIASLFGKPDGEPVFPGLGLALTLGDLRLILAQRPTNSKEQQ